MKTKNVKLREKDLHHGRVAYLAEPGYPIVKVLFWSGAVPNRVKYRYRMFDISEKTPGILSDLEQRIDPTLKHSTEDIATASKVLHSLTKTSDYSPSVMMEILGAHEDRRVLHRMPSWVLFEESQVGLFKKRRQAEEYLTKIKPDPENHEILHEFLET